MSLISTFGGVYCDIDPAIEALLKKTGYRLIVDADIIERANRSFTSPKAKLAKVFSADNLAFNRFTHERNYYIAQLKLILAQQLIVDDGYLINGFAGQLIPRRISHNLRVIMEWDSQISMKHSEWLNHGLTKSMM